jgi:hypothetical protein
LLALHTCLRTLPSLPCCSPWPCAKSVRHVCTPAAKCVSLVMFHVRCVCTPASEPPKWSRVRERNSSDPGSSWPNSALRSSHHKLAPNNPLANVRPRIQTRVCLHLYHQCEPQAPLYTHDSHAVSAPKSCSPWPCAKSVHHVCTPVSKCGSLNLVTRALPICTRATEPPKWSRVREAKRNSSDPRLSWPLFGSDQDGQLCTLLFPS